MSCLTREKVSVMCWYSGSIHRVKFQESFGSSIPCYSFGAWASWEVEDLHFDWLEGEAKGGKEDATMLNGDFKGGVEGEA